MRLTTIPLMPLLAASLIRPEIDGEAETFVVSDVLLFALFVSCSLAVTVAVFVMFPVALGVPEIAICALPALDRPPSTQVT